MQVEECYPRTQVTTKQINQTFMYCKLLVISISVAIFVQHQTVLAQYLPEQSNQELIVCGEDQVIIFDPERSTDSVPYITWRWKASEAFGLPTRFRLDYFDHVNECKPVSEGRELLVTSSSGGVALIDIESKRVIFYTFVPNAHSGEKLPGHRLVIASSIHKHGNRLVLLDIDNPGTPLFEDSLYSANGIVWDKQRAGLYASGYDELRSYELADWFGSSPRLKMTGSWTMPGIDGHDLAAHSMNPNGLLLSERGSVWEFDKTLGQFKPFQSLANQAHITSVAIHPVSGRQAFVRAEISGGSHRVHVQHPAKNFVFPGVDLYRARWRMTGQCSTEATPESFMSRQAQRHVMIAAHRGDWHWAPENSIQAFQNCMDRGIDILEVDVRLTKDKVPVIIHDLTLDRTSTGQGLVANLTLSQLKELRLRSALEVVTDERIPTLEEVAELARNRAILYLDKSGDKIKEILPVLQRTQTLNQTMFVLSATVVEAQNTFGPYLDSVLFVPVVSDDIVNLEAYVDDHLRAGIASAFQFRIASYEDECYRLLPKVTASGRRAFVAATWPHHTIGHDDQLSRTNPDDGWGWLIDQGFSILETNHPYELLSYLHGRGLRCK